MSNIFVTVLTAIFVAAKLIGFIEWSWIWVLSPIWISFGLGILVILSTLLGAGIAVGITRYIFPRPKRDREDEDEF
jgi:hypothetical protein